MIVIVAIIVFAYVFFKGGKKKNKFLLYNKTGDKITTYTGQIKHNAKNKKDRFFYISELDATLPIIPPTTYIDGEPCREIKLNHLTEYSYLQATGEEIPDSEDLKEALKENKIKVVSYAGEKVIKSEDPEKKALTHEEKQITLFRLQQYQEKYQIPITKGEIALLIGFIILFILSLVGNGYTLFQSGKNLGYVNDVSKQTEKIVGTMKALTDNQVEILTLQSQLVADYRGTGNATRQIS